MIEKFVTIFAGLGVLTAGLTMPVAVFIDLELFAYGMAMTCFFGCAMAAFMIWSEL